MGFRFRKKLKIAPGVDINLSKKGLSSLSLGKRGATVNVSNKGKIAQTIGLPGTGLSYRTDKSTAPWLFWLILLAIGLILVLAR